jgi:hypothetical protein
VSWPRFESATSKYKSEAFTFWPSFLRDIINEKTIFPTIILKGQCHLEDLGVDGRMTLKWMLDILGGMVGTGLMKLRIDMFL